MGLFVPDQEEYNLKSSYSVIGAIVFQCIFVLFTAASKDIPWMCFNPPSKYEKKRCCICTAVQVGLYFFDDFWWIQGFSPNSGEKSTKIQSTWEMTATFRNHMNDCYQCTSQTDFTSGKWSTFVHPIVPSWHLVSQTIRFSATFHMLIWFRWNSLD